MKNLKKISKKKLIKTVLKLKQSLKEQKLREVHSEFYDGSISLLSRKKWL